MNKIAKIIEIWIKRSVKQLLKSKSTKQHLPYCSIYPGHVKSIEVRGSAYILEQTLQTLGQGLLQIERIST